jgi:sugar lactone lactonase YvrE
MLEWLPLSLPRGRLAESPLWDHRTHTLYWVDILGGALHLFSFETGELKTYRLDDYVSCVALTQDVDTVIVTLKNQIAELNTRSGAHRVVARVEEPGRNRLNDCKCSPAGELWFGSMDMYEREPTGSLYVYTGSTLKRVMSGVTISNGIDWSPDGSLMYYVDSPTRKVGIYKWEGGRLEPSGYIDLSRMPGVPDGLTVDAEGSVWVAMYGGSSVVKITGADIQRLPLPYPYVTSCAFGGPRLDTLFITTGSGDGGAGADGGLLAVKTGARGRAANICNF